jgi:hypothetical protein
MHDGRIDAPLHDWHSLDEAGLRDYAATHVGWATDEMADPADLHWTLEHLPLDAMAAVHVDWEDWHRDEVAPNPRCAWMTPGIEFHSPVVVSIESGEPIIWDGWHRIAHAIHEGRGTIHAVTGRETSS